MHKKPFRPLTLIAAIIIGLSFSSIAVAAENFPQYDNIQPNVSFWVKAYSKYTTQQAVVHDSTHLNLIYDVIDLKPHDAYRARKINRQRMKKARAKYRKILKRLAANPSLRSRTARRVAALFGPNASADTYRRAAKRVRCQIGQRDRFRAGLIRSGAYIDRIREIFTANGLPVELAYLPHVESSFNYQAYSKFGAAGIWQFTRSTGKRFMEVGYVLDERRDPLCATHAAVALLKENFQKLGSWPLAITAYNHGASGMARAKRKFGDYPSIFDHYHSRTFKFASRNFYSEFLAAVHVASNYETYFGELTLDRPLPTRKIRLEAYVDFDDLCRHYGVSAEIVKSLNPALRQPVFNGQKYVPKGYTFHIPAGLEVASAESNALPSALYKHRQKPSRFYTVQRGDTAGRIARNHDVKLSDLILANNLGRRATIYPRQTLRIPVPGASPPPMKKQPPEKTEPVLLAKADPAEHDKVHSAPAESEKTYPEPVLASVIPTSLPRIEPTAVQEEREPMDAQVPSAEVVSVDVRFVRIHTHPKRPVGTIQVEVEETLGHFADWAGVRTQEIRRLNGLPFGNKLHLHQKVKIPLRKVSAQAFEEKRYEYHKRLQEDFFAVYRIGELRAYRVQRGDNLWTLGLNKFDIPMWLLKNCNPEIDFAALRMQQKLVVPTIEKQSMDAPEMETDSEPEELEEPETPLSML
jgi:membrane-bound lytic murein transglycosylase D